MKLQGSSSLHFYIVKGHYKIIGDNLSSTFYAFKIDNVTNIKTNIHNAIIVVVNKTNWFAISLKVKSNWVLFSNTILLKVCNREKIQVIALLAVFRYTQQSCFITPPKSRY